MKINNLNNYTYSFNAKEEKDKIVQWIQDWFEENGKNCKAIVGVSGGKDSTVVAALCVEALGKERVIGIVMPNGIQRDIGEAIEVVKHLNIRCMVTNIEKAFNGVLENINDIYTPKVNEFIGFDISEQTRINLAPRIRMATLYAISQSVNGRVANTSNLSEATIGYETRWGDAVGDFSPLVNYTATEVIAIGKELGLPIELLEKAPADGLTGKTDEDALGFTYEALDKFIRTGICENEEDKRRILNLYEKNYFKHFMPQSYDNNLPFCI